LFEKTRGIDHFQCYTSGRSFRFGCIESRLHCCPLCKVSCDIWVAAPDP
jgi:hypothetical protein